MPDGTTAYEIDKSTGFFVALEAKTSETEIDTIDRVLDEFNLDADGFSDSRSWNDANETITIGAEGQILRRL